MTIRIGASLVYRLRRSIGTRKDSEALAEVGSVRSVVKLSRGAASRLVAENVGNSAMISREAAFEDSLAQRARKKCPPKISAESA